MSVLDDFARDVGAMRKMYDGDPPPAAPPDPDAVWGWDHFGEPCWIESDAAFRRRLTARPEPIITYRRGPR